MQPKPQKTPAAPKGARKFRIKRRGGLIPTVCLVLLLAVIAVLAWLICIGLPDSALRAIEEAAGKEGIYLHIGKLRLKPASGLAFEVDELELYRQEGDATPLVSLGNGMFEIRWKNIFRGNYHPRRAELNNFRANFPVTDQPDTPLTLSTNRFAIRTNSRNVVNISEGELDLSGLHIHIVGAIQIPKLTDAEDDDGGDTGEETPSGTSLVEDALAAIQPYVDKVEAVLDHQNWKDGEFPDIVISPVVQQGRQVYSLRVTVPKLEVDQFHLRNGLADATVEEDVLTLHKLDFHTVSPDSSFSIRGAYKFDTREVEARLQSDAPVIQMLNRALGEDSPDILRKFHHKIEDAPEITLRCNLRFDPDYHPENIAVYTAITQSKLFIGASPVNEAKLEMRYVNGEFSIPVCKLELPDGNVSLIGKSKDGDGTAIFTADVDVDSLLALVSEFTGAPITLPDNLTLKGHTTLSLGLDLKTHRLEPGELDWKNYVPNVQGLTLDARVEVLVLDGYDFAKAHIAACLENIKQDADYIPVSAENARFTLGGERVTLPLGDGTPALHLQSPKVEANCNKIDLTGLREGAPSLSLQASGLQATFDSLAYGEGQTPEAGLEGADLKWHCRELHALRLGGEGKKTSIRGMGADLRLKRAQYGDFSLQEVTLEQKEDIGSLDLAQDWGKQINALLLTLSAKELRHGDTPLGAVTATAGYTNKEADQAAVTLTYTPEDGQPGLQISAIPCWADPDTPEFRQISLEHQNLSLLTPLLEHFGIDLYGFLLPEDLHLLGEARYDIPNARLIYATFDLSTPALTRQPRDVAALAGKDATISLNAKGRISTSEKGGLVYTADLVAGHGKDQLEARITGDSTMLSVTGTNSIRADVLDQLIDEETTHSIIRDFQFRPDSVTKATDIDTQVYFADPRYDICVKSKCKADLRNLSYMLFGIEEENGKERVRTDLDPDPFVSFHHASCDVIVDVQYGRKGADGKPLKDICSVTLSNAVMEYDNTPWLRYRGFDKGEPSSTVTGDSIVIDIENDLVEIRNVQGRAYPAYAFGAYYADLIGFMEIISIPTPVEVRTEGCVFPYDSASPKPFSGTISMKSDAECKLNLLGTSIPLQECSGFIHFEGDTVLLDRLNAGCWDGVVDAVVKFDFSGKHVSVDGYTTASCLNLRHIAAAYGGEQKDALCHARIRFYGPTLELRDLQAYGDASIADGDLLHLRIFSPVISLISNVSGYFSKLEKAAAKAVGYEGDGDYLSDLLDSTGELVGMVGNQLDNLKDHLPLANYFLGYSLNRADTTFRIEKGHLTSKDLTATGTNLTINAMLDLDLDTLQLNGNLWPQIYSVPAIIVSPIKFLSRYVINIKLRGPLDDLDWSFGLDKRPKGAPSSATSTPLQKR